MTLDPREVLEFLRWEADSQIVNHFGEHVWLRSVSHEEWVERARDAGLPQSDQEKFPNGYITDCCFVEDPCERHATLPRMKQIRQL